MFNTRKVAFGYFRLPSKRENGESTIVGTILIAYELTTVTEGGPRPRWAGEAEY